MRIQDSGSAGGLLTQRDLSLRGSLRSVSARSHTPRHRSIRPRRRRDRFTEEFLKRLQFGQGVALARATKNDLYFALARTVRQQLMSRWLETLGTQMQAKAKVVAYLSAEYLLGRQLDNALLASGLTEIAEKSMAGAGHRPGHACATPRSSRAWATAASAGWPPASSTRWPPCASRPSATASVTSTASSGRPSSTAARSSSPTPGWPTGRRGSSRTRRCGSRSGSPAHTEQYEDEDGVTRTRWNPAGRSSASPTTTWSRATATAASTPCGCGAPRPPRRSTCRCSTPATTCRRCARRPSPRTSARCSTRRIPPRRARSCGCSSSTSSSPARSRDYIDNILPPGFDLHRLPERVIFQLNDTHPVIAIPELMRILVDEQRLRLGRGVGHHPAVLRLHLPHPAARGARGVAGRPARPAAAAAPGDHLPDQRGVPGRAARGLPGRRAAGPADVDHRRSTRSARSGWPTWRRSPARRSTASRSCTPQLLRDKVLPDFSALLAGEVHQRHQRRHARAGSCGWPTRGCPS